MADVEVVRSHSLGLDGARSAVEQVAQKLEDDLGVDYRWAGNTLEFDGEGAEGNIEVEEGVVRVSIDLPMFLQPMRSRVEAEAEKYLDRYL